MSPRKGKEDFNIFVNASTLRGTVLLSFISLSILCLVILKSIGLASDPSLANHPAGVNILVGRNDWKTRF
jgi:hypothetical protein